MTSSFQVIQAGFKVGSHSNSHCGAGTGAEGWSVSPGRGAGGSVRGSQGSRRMDLIIIKDKVLISTKMSNLPFFWDFNDFYH